MFSYYIVAVSHHPDTFAPNADAVEGALKVGIDGAPKDTSLDIITDVKVTGPFPSIPQYP